jgi:predicted amidohydrolase YtcJ
MNRFLPFLLVLSVLYCCSPSVKQADVLLVNGKIWTGDDTNAWAEWIAVKDGKILEVGSAGQSFTGKATGTIDLNKRLLVPGFNDSHVHFASAGHLLLNINLLDVNNRESFIERIKETTQRIPKGSWITRGDWGAYEAWAMGSAGGDTKKQKFVPHRNMIDSIAKDYPVLVTRYDRKMGLANEAALDFLGIDSDDGILEGALLTDALKRIPEKSFEQKLAESRRALEECRKWGVTTVQDMSPPDQLDVYAALRKNGELTCRINFSPSRLSDYEMMKQQGWTINHNETLKQKTAGDEWISFGTLKTHIDGIMGARSAMFFKPYDDNDFENRNWRGSWREFSGDMPSFKEMIIKADEANIQLRIHAIGDMANFILLDILDTLNAVNGPKERRFRLVHAQVIREEDFTKLRNKNIVAEVQPYHVTDDMRWMEERIGTERCEGAYAFKTLQENECTLSFGSDWPGTNASYYPVSPLYGLYAAVTRQTLSGEPSEGWFPEQRISLEESLKAYTYGSAYGAFEENIKGRIMPGMLADFAVLDTDLFTTSPEQWLKANVVLTIAGGKVVFQQ